MSNTYSLSAAIGDLNKLTVDSGIEFSQEDRECLSTFLAKVVMRETSTLEEVLAAAEAKYLERKKMHLAAMIENERLTALVQLGLKIIERGPETCEADAAELSRFLHEASKL